MCEAYTMHEVYCTHDLVIMTSEISRGAELPSWKRLNKFFLDKIILNPPRAHKTFLFTIGILLSQIHPFKLIYFPHKLIIKALFLQSVMTDSLQPPDFILILNAIPFISYVTVCLKENCPDALPSRTCYVWKHYINDIFPSPIPPAFFFFFFHPLQARKLQADLAPSTRGFEVIVSVAVIATFSHSPLSCPNSFSSTAFGMDVQQSGLSGSSIST